MAELAVKVEGLSKVYRLGSWLARYGRLTETLWQGMTAPFNRGRNQPRERIEREYVWALKEIFLEVPEGEAIGIIGRNGAGKSTLLKILSRITEPTEGLIEIRGRVGSLLEVGTGFHPELTGRENIYLSAAILGMGRAEINRKFDEIVSFSEIGRFLDTPVKRYSSGMEVRLAFAVAAHLEPEILIVDEVLSVGDVQFQRKCLNRMQEVAQDGRTVLFVGHNMSTINRLCDSAVWLEQGRVVMRGTAEEVTKAYLGSGLEARGERRWLSAEEAPGDERIRLRAVRVVDDHDAVSATIDIQRPWRIEIEYETFVPMPNLRIILRVLTADGTVVLTSADSHDGSGSFDRNRPGVFVSCCELPGSFLNSGRYSVTVKADVPAVKSLFSVNVLAFQVQQTSTGGALFPEKRAGVVAPALPWQVRQLR